MGSIAKAASRTGFRPHWSTCLPLSIDTGSITSWAEMMQNDIIAVASEGFAAASFCPTRGSKGALAK